MLSAGSIFSPSPLNNGANSAAETNNGGTFFSVSRKSSSHDQLASPLKSPSKWYNPFSRKSSSKNTTSEFESNDGVFKKPKPVNISQSRSQPSSPMRSADGSNGGMLTAPSNPMKHTCSPEKLDIVHAKTPSKGLGGKLTSPGLKFGLKITKPFKSRMPSLKSAKDSGSAETKTQNIPTIVFQTCDESESQTHSLPSLSSNSNCGVGQSVSVAVRSANASSEQPNQFVDATSFMETLTTDKAYTDFAGTVQGRHTIIGAGDLPKLTPTPAKPPRPSLTKNQRLSESAASVKSKPICNSLM